MRRVRPLVLLALALFVYVLPASATEPRSISPPVIRETFTPLPCPADPAARGTTIGALGCAQQRILRTDARINRLVKAIFPKLYDTNARRLFAAAERSWLAYRQKSCRSVADVLRGGSAQPVLFANCVVERNLEHLEHLVSDYKLVRRR